MLARVLFYFFSIIYSLRCRDKRLQASIHIKCILYSHHVQDISVLKRIPNSVISRVHFNFFNYPIQLSAARYTQLKCSLLYYLEKSAQVDAASCIVPIIIMISVKVNYYSASGNLSFTMNHNKYLRPLHNYSIYC